MPSWFRPEDKHGHIAHKNTERVILQFGKKAASKADKKKNTAEYSIVSGQDPQAVNGMTLSELDIDEAQNVANFSVLLEESRPHQWAEVNGKMRLIRTSYGWGTGNAKGKHSKEFDDEYQKVKSQMEQGKDTGGWVALFFDGFCRPGVDQDHYFKEWSRIAQGDNSKTSTLQDRKLIFASRFPLTDEDALPLYGYGVKSFILSMIEMAMSVSEKTISLDVVEKIIGLGKEMLEKPIELLDDVEDVLHSLSGRYRLVVATKGDLLDQERKLKKSGLEHYFHLIEIMSEKREVDYRKLIKHLDIAPEEFVKIGNSLKSDVLPVLTMGGHGFHVPFHTTWAFEQIDHRIEHPNFKEFTSLKEVLAHL